MRCTGAGSSNQGHRERDDSADLTVVEADAVFSVVAGMALRALIAKFTGNEAM